MCRLKRLTESLQRGHCLCCVGCGLGRGEVHALLRVVMVLGTGAHDISV